MRSNYGLFKDTTIKQIPLGREPNLQEKAFLRELGFHLNKDYSLDVPANQYVRCEIKDQGLNYTIMSVFNKGAEIIKIIEKPDRYDSYIFFDKNVKILYEDLIKSKSKIEEKKVSRPKIFPCLGM